VISTRPKRLVAGRGTTQNAGVEATAWTFAACMGMKYLIEDACDILRRLLCFSAFQSSQARFTESHECFPV